MGDYKNATKIEVRKCLQPKLLLTSLAGASGFLKIAFVRNIGMCMCVMCVRVCVCVCVCASTPRL